MNISFDKVIGGDFDRVTINTSRSSDWMTIEMRVGWDVERVTMTLRSFEAISDLHYALGRYLDLYKHAQEAM